MLLDDLAITAQLASLELSDDEMGRFADSVGKLLDFFAHMDSFESPPAPGSMAGESQNRVRDDAAIPYEGPDLLANAPDLEGRFIGIPNVL
jgi:Asp-tRNA(Asn)/Glu-tRNA(Gln) amidotransferase C subunit